MDHKKAVQHQFSNSAEAYVTSAIHKKGKDLELLVQLAELTGQEKVLDVATGGGHTANALAPFSKEVVALDLTEKMLEVARTFIKENGQDHVTFIQGDAESMPLDSEQFDVVTSRIAPHHFPHIDRFISEVARVLKPNGLFLLDDNVAPEREDWDHFYNKVEKWRDPSHHRALKKTEWLQKIELEGFEILQTYSFPKTFVFDSWFDRMKQPQEEKTNLEAFILNTSDDTKKKFRIELKDGALYSFQGEAVLIKARKL